MGGDSFVCERKCRSEIEWIVTAEDLFKANFQSARFSERAEFLTIKSCSAVTIHSISERHFLSQTKEFPPARKIPLTGNWALLSKIPPARKIPLTGN